MAAHDNGRHRHHIDSTQNFIILRFAIFYNLESISLSEIYVTDGSVMDNDH